MFTATCGYSDRGHIQIGWLHSEGTQAMFFQNATKSSCLTGCLTGGPVQLTTTQDVEMEMINGLSAIGSCINYNAVAVG